MSVDLVTTGEVIWVEVEIVVDISSPVCPSGMGVDVVLSVVDSAVDVSTDVRNGEQGSILVNPSLLLCNVVGILKIADVSLENHICIALESSVNSSTVDSKVVDVAA